MSGHEEHAPGPRPSSASAQANVAETLILRAAVATPETSTGRGITQGKTNDEDTKQQQQLEIRNSPPVTRRPSSSTPFSNSNNNNNNNNNSNSNSNSNNSNNNNNKTTKTRSVPHSLPPGAIAQAQAQFPAALATQLQLQASSSSPSPPTLNLVPATPGLASTCNSSSSKPSTSDLPTSNPSTLSKHKGLPVLPYLVTPKEEKSHAAILGLWEYDESSSYPSSGKSASSKVTISSKGPPSTSGSSKVVTSMGAEAGRKALLALQSVAAEEGAPISIGGEYTGDNVVL
ncbi:hypothetical protein BGZ65_012116, partial [Modicella reniformis]